MHCCCLVLLLGFVPGILAVSVTVNPAAVRLDEDAVMTCTYTLGEYVLGNLVWFKCDAYGNELGDSIISNESRSQNTNGNYSLSDNGSLIIHNVEVQDAGCYLCRIIYSGDTADGYALLTVYLPTTTGGPTTGGDGSGGGGGSGGNGGGGGGGKPPIAPIIGGVIGCLVLVALIVGLSYKYDKLCFSRNEKKTNGSGSENIGLNSNFSDVDINTYAQVQKPKPVKATKSEHSEQAVTQTKPPDKPQRAPSRDRANVEQLTYADLDLVKSEGKIIHTDPETEYSSVRTEKQLTYADLDLTKDVNTGSKDKIIRTQPETEYSSVMITKK